MILNIELNFIRIGRIIMKIGQTIAIIAACGFLSIAAAQAATTEYRNHHPAVVIHRHQHPHHLMYSQPHLHHHHHPNVKM
jgi:hypothetical protein